MLLIHIFTALSVFHLCTAVKTCNESEAESFNFHAILGRWFAVGVAYEGKGKITDSPKARIPDPEENMCFMLEFVKTDESELKQYLQNFPNAKERSDIFEVIKGSPIKTVLHRIRDRACTEMLNLFAKPPGRVGRILKGYRRFAMLYFRCGIQAKVDFGLPQLQPRNDNSTLNETGSVPYEVGGNDLA
ncbi:hypothetical protein EVAR_68872_1 [Eumeta japonica]|uniref:Uncharacterized protein n=1 Tax=Eumeta variegata TaxID=151549 RepID=A0A4C2ADE3_EUMVA|nr:hypothetical protein EVAR_68872_1 [Eumeta japonica]